MAQVLKVENIKPSNLVVNNIKGTGLSVENIVGKNLQVFGQVEKFFPVTSSAGQSMGLLLALTYKEGFTVNSNITS